MRLIKRSIASIVFASFAFASLSWMSPFSAMAGPDLNGDFQQLVESAFRNRAAGLGNARTAELSKELIGLIKHRSRDDLERAKGVGYELAQIYLKDRRIQEAIWTLDRAQLHGHAEYLTEKLKTFLMNAPGNKFAQVGNGISKSLRVDLSPFSAIAKMKSSDHVNGDPSNQASIETFGYEFDRYIGLGRVATTVLRPFNNDQASFQYMLSNAHQSNIGFFGSVNNQLPFNSEVWVFDYLLDNSDRHGGNSLMTAEGELVLIDQGRTFWGARNRERENVELKNGAVIDPDLLRNIHDLPTNELSQKFSPLISRALISSLINRIELLTARYPRPPGPSLRRRGWELANLRALPAIQIRDRVVKVRQEAQPELPMALPKVHPAPAVIDVNMDLNWFEKQLDISRGDVDAGKARAIQQVLTALNDPKTLPAILHQFADRKRLAHFIEDHVNLLSPATRTAYIAAINNFNKDNGRAFDRAIRSCRAAVNGQGKRQ